MEWRGEHLKELWVPSMTVGTLQQSFTMIKPLPAEKDGALIQSSQFKMIAGLLLFSMQWEAPQPGKTR